VFKSNKFIIVCPLQIHIYTAEVKSGCSSTPILPFAF